jgi:hypothetical protein
MSGLGHPLGEDRGADQLGGILVGELRGRHPGEGGELVHHPADVAHLPHDGVGAAVEDLDLLGGDVLAEFLPQPFCRELDRRQRVLDLVGDAAGDVAPGGVALGGRPDG